MMIKWTINRENHQNKKTGYLKSSIKVKTKREKKQNVNYQYQEQQGGHKTDPTDIKRMIKK